MIKESFLSNFTGMWEYRKENKFILEEEDVELSFQSILAYKRRVGGGSKRKSILSN